VKQTISIDSLKANPFQSRRTLDKAAVTALAQSMEKEGVWETVFRVRKHGDGYQLVWGHSRVDALRKLGRKRIDVEVLDLDDQEMAAESLIENVQRSNLPEIDKGEAIARWIKMLMNSNGKTRSRADAIADVMKLLGYRSTTSIENYLSMANMTEDTKKVLREHNTGRGIVQHARVIGGEQMVRHVAKEHIPLHDLEPMIKDLAELPKETRTKVAAQIVKDKLTRPEAVTRLVRREQEKAVDRDELPPDLVLFIDKWTGDLGVWTRKLHTAGKHRAYIHKHPEVATRFRAAAIKFIAALKEVVDL
jgi:ParB family chromosome partitioning protein